jgi:hypothetical protein
MLAVVVENVVSALANARPRGGDHVPWGAVFLRFLLIEAGNLKEAPRQKGVDVRGKNADVLIPLIGAKGGRKPKLNDLLIRNVDAHVVKSAEFHADHIPRAGLFQAPGHQSSTFFSM